MKDSRLSRKYRNKIIWFYCLIILTLLGWIGLSVLFAFLILSFGGNNGRTLALALFPVLYALFAVFIFLRYKPQKAKGMSVTKQTAPDLFELIESTAKEVGYEGCIEDVILTPGSSVAVSYNPNLFNLILDSRAKLQIGVTLCHVLSKEELKAVIGHELAHFTQPQTKYKAYLARISNLSSRLGKNGVFGSKEDFNVAFLGFYALPARVLCYCFNHIFEIIFNVNSSDYLEISADMELEADKISAEAFGSEVMLSALCKSSGLSDRLILYKVLILPYLSSLGFRCNGYWKTFKATETLFKSIDGLDIDTTHRLCDLNRTQFDLSECILALRLDALEKKCEGKAPVNSAIPSIEMIPESIIIKMDKLLCGKYGQTEGFIIGKIRYEEIIDNLHKGIFANIHTMSEAFIVVKGLFEEMQNDNSGLTQTVMPEYEHPSCNVLPLPVIRPASEIIYSSDIGHCPVCGCEINDDTKVCPHCHEVISE